MKWLAIVNPAAGDATRITRESSAFDGVIAIGGDGTIAEVLQGIDLARQCLAVLPAGHGNCLARDLAVADAARALAALRRGACRPLDLMDVCIGYSNGRDDRRLCASTLAVGYVTDVVTFGRLRLHQLGRAAYAAAAVVVVPETFEARVVGAADPSCLRHYTGLVINNTAHLANFRGFPDASVHDGVLDVMEQGHGWPRQLMHNVAALACSRAFGPLRLRQAPSERLEFCEARTLMADGELLHGVARVAVECRPAAVMCVVGAA